MYDQAIKGKSWRQYYYQLAVEQSDRARTEENVHLTEEALFIRWQELAGSPDQLHERIEMKRASANLLRVKTRQLGWPALIPGSKPSRQDQEHPNQDQVRKNVSP